MDVSKIKFQTPAQRILRAALRTIKRLGRRVFWLHQWDHNDVEFDKRTCTVCGQVEVPSEDGWHSGWDILIKGDHSLHYSKGE